MNHDFAALGREIHRAWFLTWRVPIAFWHDWRWDRCAAAAERHRAKAYATSQRALELGDQYPTLLRP